jgi:hypothetical protein
VATYTSDQDDVDGIDYGWDSHWKAHYKGKFTLIDPRYQKPEVLKVGQKVRIMESARELGDFSQYDFGYIKDAFDDENGVSYYIDMDGGIVNLPHYAVMPVEEEEEIQEIPELEGTIDQLSTLIEKAQEIVDKYKN